MGHADRPFRQAQLDLPAVIVAGQSQSNALLGGLGEYLRAV